MAIICNNHAASFSHAWEHTFWELCLVEKILNGGFFFCEDAVGGVQKERECGLTNVCVTCSM